MSALIVGAIWRLALRRIVDSERRHRSAEAQALLAAELAERSAAADREELSEVLRQAGPLLVRLTDGDELSPAFRLELRLTEASIRDRIRAPWAQDPTLLSVIAERRRAGVDVLLLGERPEPISAAAAAAAASLLGSTSRGSVTIHAIPPGRGAALSVLRLGNSHSERILLDADGSILDRR